jgi:hypothetical protein
MYFINFHKKYSVSFLVFTIILLSVVSATFGTISSAAFLYDDQDQTEKKSFLAVLRDTNLFSNQKGGEWIDFSSLNPVAFFSNKQTARTSSVSESNVPETSVDASSFDEFDAWVDSYVKAVKSADRNALQSDSYQVDTGASLAIKRREALKQLMAENPKAALAKAIPADVFNQLPSFVRQNSEKRISARGDFLVYAIDGINHFEEASQHSNSSEQLGSSSSSRIERAVVIGEARYKAVVYGRRQSMTTKMDIPLHGIVIDDVMVVDEMPVRVIDAKEYASRAVAAAEDINSSELEDSEAAAEIGGKLVGFKSRAQLETFVREQIEWESKIGPNRTKANSTKNGAAAHQTLATQAASTWTQGAKSILFIRVDFSDKPGVPLSRSGQPLTEAGAINLINSQVNSFYVNNSYNRTSLTATVTPVLRMPQTQSYYTQGDNFNHLLTDARAAAAAVPGNVFNPENFSFDIIGLSYAPNAQWLGIGLVGTTGNLLNGAFNASEVSHELGHNYGLSHANLYQTTNGSSIGNGGMHVEYGDCFDTMGAVCTAGSYSHFNARYKRTLDWLSAGDVETVTASGNYTIYAQDLESVSGKRALRISKDGTRDYWIEFRQLFTNNPNAMNGAIIRWEYISQEYPGTELLDMTPGTNTRGDEPLAIGQTFIDNDSGIRIQVMGKNAAAGSLDIRVDLIQYGCSYSLSSTTTAVPSEGGQGSVNVTVAGSNCSWSAVADNASWLTITGGFDGTGSGMVSFYASSNTTPSTRTGTITIGGQTFTVTQSSDICSSNIHYQSSLMESSFSFAASGGTLNYNQKPGSPCRQLLPTSSGHPWIVINNNTITVLPNNGPARESTVTLTAKNDIGTVVGTAILDVQQAAGQPATNCTYPLDTTSQNFGASGGSGVFSIKPTNPTVCSSTYSATSNTSWITISNPSGSTSNNINYTVAPNTGTASRTGTIIVNNPVTGAQTLTITQSANKKRIRITF